MAEFTNGSAMIILYADGCIYLIDASEIYVPPFWRDAQ